MVVLGVSVMVLVSHMLVNGTGGALTLADDILHMHLGQGVLQVCGEAAVAHARGEISKEGEAAVTTYVNGLALCQRKSTKAA